MINLNVSKQDLQNTQRLLQVAQQALKLHLDNYVRAYQEDEYHYTGVLKNYAPTLLSNNKSMWNRGYTVGNANVPKAKYICDIAQTTFLGNKPAITLNEKDDTALVPFKKELETRDFMSKIYDFGKDVGIYGVGYLLTFTRDGDLFPRFAVLEPKKTNVVYECGVEPRSLFGFTYDIAEDVIGSTTKQYYIVSIYTENRVVVAKTSSVIDLSMTETQVIPHFFGAVPITEAKNNKLMVGDARPAYGIIEVRNELQRNRLQNIQDVIDYVLLIKNADIGNDEDRKAFIELLKERIISLKGDNTDAKFLTNPLDQAQIQNLLDTFDKDIVQITHVPDFTNKEFAQSSSNVALQTKLLGFIGLLKEKARFFVPAVKRTLLLAKQFCENISRNDLADFDEQLLKIELKHTLPSNDQEMVGIITNMANIGLLDPKWAVSQLSKIDDGELYLKNAFAYREQKAVLDNLLKSVNNNNGGTNDTNIERQNAIPKTVEQDDNAQNNMIGDGNKISYEK